VPRKRRQRQKTVRAACRCPILQQGEIADWQGELALLQRDRNG
jgi:hypothetical protein